MVTHWHHNIDGTPTAECETIQNAGRTLQNQGVQVIMLNDTRRTPSNERALTAPLEQGRAQAGNTSLPWTYFHTHTKTDYNYAGGVTTAMSQKVVSRIGTTKAKNKAIINDSRGWGRYMATTIIGTRRDGHQPALMYLNIYAPVTSGA